MDAAGIGLRWLFVGLAAVILAAATSEVQAQSAAKIPRIGILRPGSPPDPLVDSFRDGLGELGYTEGRNVHFELRWAAGDAQRFVDLAGELVRLKVDVIVASADSILAARRATTTIPIVAPTVNDPVRSGAVTSLARPGGNITGFASQSNEAYGKRISLVKEAFPRIARIAVLWSNAREASEVEASDAASRAAGVRLLPLKFSSADDLTAAFAEAQRQRADAVLTVGSPALYVHRARIIELAAKHRLPTIYPHREFVVGAGGLMSYGANYNDLWRRSATLVDRILRGAKPADIPMEQPTKFELVVNLKAAKALGIAVPSSFLLHADEVIQ